MENEGEQLQPPEETPVINDCPECGHSLDVSDFSPYSKIICPQCDTAIRVRTMLGHYQIVQMLGEGGMSQVFKAIDLTLAREIALKIMHQELSKDSALTAMFEREAKLTASIHHPNVVKVYTVGSDQGYFYIAMEMVDATSLEHLIASGGALPEEEVLNIAHDVTSGLRAAHHEDLIHRDIKPGNMLVTPDGTAKLVDFGLAVQQGGADESEDIWATPFYVPPEKLEGDQDTFLGDIYSLGATLFHALAGHPPFAANTSSLEELKLIKAAPVSLKDSAPNTSKGTLQLVEKMMAYAPGDRPPTYSEILKQVEDIQEKTFGTKRSRAGGAKGILSSVWAKVGVGVVALLVVAALAVAFGNRGGGAGANDPILGGGSGGGERVVSAAARAQAQKFLEARELMANGNFQKAGKIFAELSTSTDLSTSTRAWNQFNQGLTQLFEGDEKEARNTFAKLKAMEKFSGEDADLMAQEAFLRKIGNTMTDSLPLLPGAKKKFASDSFESLGLLAGGLKNWNLGQLKSAAEWFDLFAGANPPQGYDWISKLKPQAENFRADLKFIEDEVPVPSRKTGADELTRQKNLMTRQLQQLKTKGAAPALLKSRIARVDKIFAIEKEEKERAARIAKEKDDAAAKEKERQQMIVNNSVKNTSPDKLPPPTKWTPEENAERLRLQEMLGSFADYKDTLLFSAAVLKLEAETFQTDKVNALKNDLRFAFNQADTFLETLSTSLGSTEYEGTVRRREGNGVPLDAKVTGASPTAFIVDLGFGPNEISVEQLAPDWLVEAAEEVIPKDNNEGREQIVWFAQACGLKEQAFRIAEELLPENPEFAGRWQRLGALRKNAQ